MFHIFAHFYAFTLIDLEHKGVAPSVYYSVCLKKKNFSFGHNFWLVADRAFIFHMCIPCGHLLRLRSNMKVTICKKKVGVGGKHWSFKNTSYLKFVLKGDWAVVWKMGLKTLYQTTKFYLCPNSRQQFQCDSHGAILFPYGRNIVGKGENACFQHFLLVPQCFQEAFFFQGHENLG